MKELSIEEKAKRYDEAIEKGKQIQNTPYTAHWDIMKEVAEHLLPELKESEDERISKELIEFIKRHKSYCDCPHDRTLNEYIAWLEKQGEQKPADNVEPKFKVGDKIVEDNEFGMVGGEITDIDDTHYELDGGSRYIPIFHQDNYKLVEQKPVESQQEHPKKYINKNLKCCEL